ncbi:type IV toxin-antitoxin system AbiEi family antitoxin [Oscillatoria sp. CS-180]|uniref:type IV toxin-antitoxin system AbiEi family antitoxin n=1 Tax=Oscillatoria sp. CS-180 TaxID=3021720 RepID=UPI00232F6351|nr:type IV toxin-antitoxin system AbiEi family antitoxin [Oscillatoria sp. CS-180]MDB9529376.1 type IV toxin-antitoxin system AbiEi family antitoxin [Oscillatoria sp. CS-180]
MHPKNPLFQKCIAYLESLPSIKAVIQGEAYFSNEVLADGKLIINTSSERVDYVCEIKTGLTNDVVEQVTEYFLNLGRRLKHNERPLLITRGLSNLVVEQLLKRNVEFIDIDGSIYLNSSKFYVLVRNQIHKENTSKSLEITAASLQVIYALLSQPKIFKQGYDFDEEVGCISGVTPKTVKNTLKKLQDLDYITYRHGRYEIVDYVRLLERWELGYSERLRAKLTLGIFAPIGNIGFSEVADKIEEYAERYDYLIGGELAASIMTEYLRPISATLHLSNNFDSRELAVNLKLKPDLEGSITFLQTFGHVKYHQNDLGKFQQTLINPLFIHAELMRTGNSRLKETAELIYDRYIEELAQRHD